MKIQKFICSECGRPGESELMHKNSSGVKMHPECYRLKNIRETQKRYYQRLPDERKKQTVARYLRSIEMMLGGKYDLVRRKDV
jgi:hypothetical protein